MTINEPQVIFGLGYQQGRIAPGLKLTVPELLEAAHNLLKAHGAAAVTLRTYAKQPLKIGYAPCGNMNMPASDAKEDIEAARDSMFSFDTPDMAIGSLVWYNDAIFFGKYPEREFKICEKYMPEIKNGYQELVVESFPWSDLGNGTAVKKVISYDVTASNVNKDNYEDSDLSNYKKETSVRKSASENFNINFNGDVERNFVTLTQDLTNERTRFDGLTFYIYMFLGSLCGIFTLLLAGGLYENASGEYIKDLIHEAHRRIKNGEMGASEQEKINKYTKKYLKLMKENEEVKNRFMELYNKYLEILDLDELKKEYNRIIK